MIFEILMTIRVGRGSFPPNAVNSFEKTGTMKTIMAVKMITMTLKYHRRVGHGRSDGPIQLRLFFDGVGQALQDIVEVTARFAGLDQCAEQVGEHLRMLGAGRRQRRSVLEIEPDFVQDPSQCRISVCPARMPRDRTTDSPESTIVDSWRVTTETSRSFTRSENPGILISVLRLTGDLGVTEIGM